MSYGAYGAGSSGSFSGSPAPDPNKYWWEGGAMQGPSAPTNPIRQGIGNFVEAIGNAAPWLTGGREGYLSERIAGGPTKQTGKVYATDGSVSDNILNSGDTGGNGGGGAGGGAITTNYNTNTNNGGANGGIPGVDMKFYQGWNDQNAINADWAQTWQQKLGQGGSGADPYAGIRNEIGSGYDNYINSLNQMMNQGLPGQRSNMEQIVGNQYQMGVGDLNTQRDMGLSDLGAERTSATQNQNKNLKDIADNIRNMFMSGNVFLGSRGAGDSSAANQYSFALQKVGNKARGDVMAQTANIQAEIGRRETMLKQTVGNEINKLAQERDNKILEVGNWFNEQQNMLRDRIGQAGLSKSTDLANLNKSLLDQAMARLQQAEADVNNRRGMLEEWAVNQSKSIGELKNNLAAVAQFNPQLPRAQQFSGTPTISGGNIRTPINWSTSNREEEKNSIFG